MQATRERVTVWMVDGRPVRLVWQGKRWRVTDTPTRLPESEPWWPPMITHIPEPLEAWRFYATSETGEVRVFDVRRIGGEWEAARVYE